MCQVELNVPAASAVTPLRNALGLPETEQSNPSLTDKQLIEQLIDRQHSGIIVQNSTTNNLVWARRLAPSETLTLPMTYSISRPADSFIEITDSFV